MLYTLGRDECQGGGHADAVVGTERRAARLHPFAVDVGLYRVGHEVEGDVGVLLAHHVHVALEHDGGFAGHRRRGFLVHHDVAGRVFPVVETVFSGEPFQVGNDFLLFFGGSGNLSDFVEDFPYGPRFEPADF